MDLRTCVLTRINCLRPLIPGILDTTSDARLGLKATAITSSGIKNRRVHRRLQDIEKLPKRDEQALLHTNDAFVSKAG